METQNIYARGTWFEVLQTTKHSQTAVMTLAPGVASSEELNAHPHSDQTLLVVEGEIAAQVGDETMLLHTGDSVVVPAGMMHRFRNDGGSRAVTFSVYAPPEYSSCERG